MKQILALAALSLLAGTAAYAADNDDEMMGTMINGHMETRGERGVRVPDPDMDREEAVIDREKRLNRDTKQPAPDDKHPQPQPYQGKLPD